MYRRPNADVGVGEPGVTAWIDRKKERGKEARTWRVALSIQSNPLQGIQSRNAMQCSPIYTPIQCKIPFNTLIGGSIKRSLVDDTERAWMEERNGRERKGKKASDKATICRTIRPIALHRIASSKADECKLSDAGSFLMGLLR